MADNKQEIKSTSFDELVKIFTDINDEKFMKDFMECLFTPAEREDFANRWTLVKEIDKGTTQREIAKNFNMSLCKDCLFFEDSLFFGWFTLIFQ